MDTKHTPGPWEFIPDNVGCINGYNPYWGIVNARSGESIVMVPCGFRFQKERDGECEANARLVAAAPDLLDALQTILPYFEGEHAYDHPDAIKARAAIEKATGSPQADAGSNTND